MKRRVRLGAVAVIAGVGLMGASCAAPTGETPGGSGAQTTSQGRVAVAYEGGIAVLDAMSLQELGQFDSEEFTRLNAFGDGRTVVVTTSRGFQLLDTATPALTELVFEAEHPGHVVSHGGRTVLFDDGTGTSTIVDTDAFADGYDELPKVTTHQARDPHHGVSIVLEDGLLLTTLADDSDRSGVIVLRPHDGHWDKETSNDQCPGVHGEGAAADEAIVFGCEDGALMYHDGQFVKFTAPDPYGRMGNAYVSPTSPIVVGDYRTDPDAEGYLLNAVALIDTQAQTYETVDLPDDVQYTWRGVARGPGGVAYILATDGRIHAMDPTSGQLTGAHQVIEAWEGPVNWQDPHPAIRINGDVAYVTEPAANKVHAVDLETGRIVASVELRHAPNEIVVAA